ncbi:MAG: hypothetical protein NZO16_05835, partial [Deltaproteobacteria bacterium]|nr:hypothetical protein [Deltaproteobacteria bacterium]
MAAEVQKRNGPGCENCHHSCPNCPLKTLLEDLAKQGIEEGKLLELANGKIRKDKRVVARGSNIGERSKRTNPTRKGSGSLKVARNKPSSNPGRDSMLTGVDALTHGSHLSQGHNGPSELSNPASDESFLKIELERNLRDSRKGMGVLSIGQLETGESQGPQFATLTDFATGLIASPISNNGDPANSLGAISDSRHVRESTLNDQVPKPTPSDPATTVFELEGSSQNGRQTSFDTNKPTSEPVNSQENGVKPFVENHPTDGQQSPNIRDLNPAKREDDLKTKLEKEPTNPAGTFEKVAHGVQNVVNRILNCPMMRIPLALANNVANSVANMSARVINSDAPIAGLFRPGAVLVHGLSVGFAERTNSTNIGESFENFSLRLANISRRLDDVSFKLSERFSKLKNSASPEVHEAKNRLDTTLFGVKQSISKLFHNLISETGSDPNFTNSQNSRIAWNTMEGPKVADFGVSADGIFQAFFGSTTMASQRETESNFNSKAGIGWTTQDGVNNGGSFTLTSSANFTNQQTTTHSFNNFTISFSGSLSENPPTDPLNLSLLQPSQIGEIAPPAGARLNSTHLNDTSIPKTNSGRAEAELHGASDSLSTLNSPWVEPKRHNPALSQTENLFVNINLTNQSQPTPGKSMIFNRRANNSGSHMDSSLENRKSGVQNLGSQSAEATGVKSVPQSRRSSLKLSNVSALKRLPSREGSKTRSQESNVSQGIDTNTELIKKRAALGNQKVQTHSTRSSTGRQLPRARSFTVFTLRVQTVKKSLLNAIKNIPRGSLRNLSKQPTNLFISRRMNRLIQSVNRRLGRIKFNVIIRIARPNRRGQTSNQKFFTRHIFNYIIISQNLIRRILTQIRTLQISRLRFSSSRHLQVMVHRTASKLLSTIKRLNFKSLEKRRAQNAQTNLGYLKLRQTMFLISRFISVLRQNRKLSKVAYSQSKELILGASRILHALKQSAGQIGALNHLRLAFKLAHFQLRQNVPVENQSQHV